MNQEKDTPVSGLKCYRIVVSGVVQGVGFRPFVYQLAGKWGVNGSVQNAAAGVIIMGEGLPNALEGFTSDLKNDLPTLAVINDYQCEELPVVGYTDFSILTSAAMAAKGKLDALIPPDVATCADCARDVFDPADRHYRYAFTNCTNCGPRFTILSDLPYDRPKTAMAVFPMCGICAAEYHNPADRRFHAQPVACPDCGPQVEIVNNLGEPVCNWENWPETAGLLLAAGKILAVKGLGGFHLVCSAHDRQAVTALRQRKGRKAKPLAVMCRDLETVQKYCTLGENEKALLASPAAPIVILSKLLCPADSATKPLAEEVAPGADTLGVMLPYTPLHLLLCNASDDVLVMTSGNYSNLPLVKDNRKALSELGGIADYFLMHNREIISRCDDSLLRVIDGEKHFYRRSRGYVPEPVPVVRRMEDPVVLGIGGEMKNSFCLLKGNQAFLSTYIGEIDCLEGEENLREGVDHLQQLIGVVPEIVAFDSHPNYASADVARRIPAKHYFPVQHHHSHLAACMADNGLDNQAVIGAILDGTGYGSDGNLWGFEIIAGDYVDFQRFWRPVYIPLPGGEAAVRQPWRTAAALLITLLGESGLNYAMKVFPDKNIELIAEIVHNGIGAPLSSGCGRIFDAVAAILGVCLENTYEGQGAVELAAALPGELLRNPFAQTDWFPYDYDLTGGVINMKKTLVSIINEQQNNVPVSVIALRFHQTLASIVTQTVGLTAEVTGCRQVVLSGGSWQNPYLFLWVRKLLRERGCRVYYHRQVPANDGGIALGQAMIAYWRWRNKCV